MKSGNYEHWEAHYKQGEKKELSLSFGKGYVDSDGKIKDYDNAIEHDPKPFKPYNEYNIEPFEPYLARGVTKLDITKSSTKDIEDVIKDLERVIEIDPKLAKAHFWLGIAKSKLKDNQSAIESFDRAIEIDSTLIEAYFERGMAQHSLNPEKAVKDYSEVLKFNHNSFTVRRHRAYLYYKLKDYLNAIRDYDYIINNHDNLILISQDYQDFIDTNPFYAVHYFYLNRGKASFCLNNFQEAIEDFSYIIENSDSDDSYYSDAFYYCELVKSRLASDTLS